MNICFLNSGFERHGGIERVVSVFLNELANRENMRIFSLSLYSRGGDFVYSIPDTVQVDYLFPSPLNMRKALLKGAGSKIREYIRKNRIDVLVACGVIYFPLACLGRKGTGCKIICWEHTNPASTHDFRFEGISRKYGAKKSDLNILISQSGLNYYTRHFRKDGNLLIHNPAARELFEKPASYCPDSRKLISVGRLTYAKNYPLLIDIASEVLPAHEGWTWDIYGDGDERAELEAKIIQKGLEGRVVLKGTVSDIYDRYPEYSALVMTSRYEGFPMVLIEGAAKGLPMVSFDIETGPNEIIRDGINGFLVPDGDMAGMVEKLHTLIEDTDMRHHMSHQATEAAKRFDLSLVADEWEQCFRRLNQ